MASDEPTPDSQLSQNEDALRVSEDRLRLIIESVQDYAIYTVTPDNQIDTWNTGAERIIGYADTEVIGQDGAIIFTPEDRIKGAPEQELHQAFTNGRAAQPVTTGLIQAPTAEPSGVQSSHWLP